MLDKAIEELSEEVYRREVNRLGILLVEIEEITGKPNPELRERLSYLKRSAKEYLEKYGEK